MLSRLSFTGAPYFSGPGTYQMGARYYNLTAGLFTYTLDNCNVSDEKLTTEVEITIKIKITFLCINITLMLLYYIKSKNPK